MKSRYTILKIVILVFILLDFQVQYAHAGPIPPPNRERNIGDEQQQLQRDRQLSEERNRREKQKDVLLQSKSSRDGSDFPEESPTFFIKKISIISDDLSAFKWLQKEADRYSQHNIGQKGLALLSKRLGNMLIDRGYITSKVFIPEQDISKGKLDIQIIGGRIGDIRFEPMMRRADWRSAFPVKPGDLLNLRDLEQGLEQLKRVPTQDVDFQLVPGKIPGLTDVVIQLQRICPTKFILSLDNAGNPATGKWQTSFTYSQDNLAGKNDLFSFTYNKDADKNGTEKGIHGNAFSWSFPNGYWTYSLNYYTNHYRQTVSYAANAFFYSGDTETWAAKAERLLRRTKDSKMSVSMALLKSSSHNYINGTEIIIQKKATTALETALNYRKYIKQDIWDYQLAYRQGLPWFGAQDDTGREQTSRYGLWTAEINWQKPASLWGVASRYTMTLRGQYTQDRLYSSEDFSIGNRYTVRGFDGEETLMGEKGFYLRNEMAIPLKKQTEEIYAALDYGYVSENGENDLPEQILVGAALGFRGNISQVNFDIFVGWPLKKPESMKSGNPTFGFQCNWKL